MKRFCSIIIMLISGLFLTGIFVTPVSAVGTCDLLPCGTDESGNVESRVTTTIEEAVLYSTSFIFIVIILLGVGFIVRGAVDMERAQGREEVFTRGVQTVKGVYWGIIMFFLGFIGLAVVVAFFGGGTLVGPIEVPTGVTLPFF